MRSDKQRIEKLVSVEELRLNDRRIDEIIELDREIQRGYSEPVLRLDPRVEDAEHFKHAGVYLRRMGIDYDKR